MCIACVFPVFFLLSAVARTWHSDKVVVDQLSISGSGTALNAAVSSVSFEISEFDVSARWSGNPGIWITVSGSGLVGNGGLIDGNVNLTVVGDLDIASGGAIEADYLTVGGPGEGGEVLYVGGGGGGHGGKGAQGMQVANYYTHIFCWC